MSERTEPFSGASCQGPISPVHSEDGSEVVSHVVLQGLVVLVVLAMLQIGLALHTRNLAVSAAGEGARRAALVGGDEADGRERTDRLLDEFIGVSRSRDISVETQVVEGRATIVVTVSTVLPVLVTWGPSGSLTVRGRSLVETPDG